MNEIIRRLVQYDLQLRVYHWQAKTRAQHDAYDVAASDWAEHLDRFVELLRGKSRPLSIPVEGATLHIVDINSSEPGKDLFQVALKTLLVDLPPELDAVKDVDLFSVRDDMVAVVNDLRAHLSMA